MATYTLESFVRQVPNVLLKQYLSDESFDVSLEWEKLKENDVTIICDAIRALPDPVTERIEATFSEILNQASDKLVEDILGSALDQDHPLNFSPKLDEIGGPLQFCFWASQNHKDIYEDSLMSNQIRRLCKIKRNDIPESAKAPSAACIEDLTDAMRGYYKTKGKGDGGSIAHRVLGDRHVFVCYLEDHPRTSQEFINHILQSRTNRPAFEVVLAYDCKLKELRAFVPGGRAAVNTVTRIFGKSALEVDLPDMKPDEPEEIYDLEVLLDPGFVFEINAVDPIEQVVLKELQFEAREIAKHYVTYSVPAVADAKAIYSIMSDGMLDDAARKVYKPVKATFRALLTKRRKKRKQYISFTVTLPDTSSLGEDKIDQHIAALLKRWKIDIGETTLDDPFAA